MRGSCSTRATFEKRRKRNANIIENTMKYYYYVCFGMTAVRIAYTSTYTHISPGAVRRSKSVTRKERKKNTL